MKALLHRRSSAEIAQLRRLLPKHLVRNIMLVVNGGLPDHDISVRLLLVHWYISSTILYSEIGCLYRVNTAMTIWFSSYLVEKWYVMHGQAVPRNISGQWSFRLIKIFLYAMLSWSPAFFPKYKKMLWNKLSIYVTLKLFDTLKLQFYMNLGLSDKFDGLVYALEINLPAALVVSFCAFKLSENLKVGCYASFPHF